MKPADPNAVHVVFCRHEDSSQNDHNSPLTDAKPSQKGWDQLKDLRTHAGAHIQKIAPLWTTIEAGNYEVHTSPLVRAFLTGLVLEQSIIDSLKKLSKTKEQIDDILDKRSYTIYNGLQEIGWYPSTPGMNMMYLSLLQHLFSKFEIEVNVFNVFCSFLKVLSESSRCAHEIAQFSTSWCARKPLSDSSFAVLLGTLLKML